MFITEDAQTTLQNVYLWGFAFFSCLMTCAGFLLSVRLPPPPFPSAKSRKSFRIELVRKKR